MNPNQITPPSTTPTNEVFVAPPNEVAVQTPPTSPSQKIFIISGVGLLVLILVGGVWLVLPKFMTSNFIANLKPQLQDLKTNTEAVKSSINAIHYDITQNSNSSSDTPVRSSGLLVHPQVASLLVGSDILGVSTKNLGPLESAISDISDQVRGKLSSLIENKNVAAANSNSESPDNTIFRMVKDETQKTSSNITKAQNNLVSINSKVSSSPLFLSGSTKDKISQNPSLTGGVKSYLDEAQKVSNYYQSLSSMLIDMNTKINSFKTALSATTTTFGQLRNQNLSTSQIKSILDQSQIYLNQAKKDTDDIKQITSDFKNIPSDSLPQLSAKYHQHNIQVLDTVRSYFDAESTIMQSFIDETNNLLAKSQTNQLTTADILLYLTKINSGGQQATLADTKFVSDLGSLTGEEAPLTNSFWQDNGILTKGDQVDSDLNSLQNDLNSL